MQIGYLLIRAVCSGWYGRKPQGQKEKSLLYMLVEVERSDYMDPIPLHHEG